MEVLLEFLPKPPSFPEPNQVACEPKQNQTMT